MVKIFCKIAPSGRCAKTQNKNEDDSNCTFNTTTNRCNKSNLKKKVKTVKNFPSNKKKDNTSLGNTQMSSLLLSNDKNLDVKNNVNRNFFFKLLIQFYMDE